jgi:hypothetical protein
MPEPWTSMMNLYVLDITRCSGLTGSLPAGLQQRYDDNLLTVYWAGSRTTPPSGIAPWFGRCDATNGASVRRKVVVR